jgi:DNA-directed RNA polymerase specialized sigma24 family protein
VVDLLSRLPERQRITACLFYVADYSVDEIADAMGCRRGP